MTRWEFMRQLEELLDDIAPAEREEALQYYNDYFNDAGRENEQEVIAALGSPAQVAKVVKEGLFGEGQGDFRENSFDFSEGATDSSTNQEATGNSFFEQIKSLPTWAIVLIIIGCVVFSPVILGAIGTILGAIFSVITTAVGVLIGFAITTVALYVVAIVLVIVGISMMLSAPFAGLALIGAGLICAAIGILFMVLSALIYGKGLPLLWEGCKYLYEEVMKKVKGVQA